MMFLSLMFLIESSSKELQRLVEQCKRVFLFWRVVPGPISEDAQI